MYKFIFTNIQIDNKIERLYDFKSKRNSCIGTLFFDGVEYNDFIYIPMEDVQRDEFFQNLDNYKNYFTLKLDKKLLIKKNGISLNRLLVLRKENKVIITNSNKLLFETIDLLKIDLSPSQKYLKQVLHQGFSIGPTSPFREIEYIGKNNFLIYNGEEIIIQESKNNFIFNNRNEYDVNKIRNAFIDSFDKRVDKNTKVGIFLSGGIDSSVLASIAANFMENEKIETYTFSYKTLGKKSEVEYAKKVNDYLNIDGKQYIFDKTDIDALDLEEFVYYDYPYFGTILLRAIYKDISDSNEDYILMTGHDTRAATGCLNKIDNIHRNFSVNKNISTKYSKKLMKLLFGIEKLLFGIDIPDKYKWYFSHFSRLLLESIFAEKKYLIDRFCRGDELYLFSKLKGISNDGLIKLDIEVRKEIEKIFKNELEFSRDNYFTSYIDFQMKYDQENYYIPQVYSLMDFYPVKTVFPFFDTDIIKICENIPEKIRRKELKGYDRFSNKRVKVNKFVLRDVFKNTLPKDILYRKKAVADTIYLFYNDGLKEKIYPGLKIINKITPGYFDSFFDWYKNKNTFKEEDGFLLHRLHVLGITGLKYKKWVIDL